MEIKGYITNLGKYNEGEIVGKWIDFPIYEEELNEVFKEIGVCYYDEDGEYIKTGCEEFFFTDWETDFSNDFGEYEDIDIINEIAENFANWYDEDKLKAACEIWAAKEVSDNGEDYYNFYSGVNDDYDLGYYWIEESGCYDLSNMGKLKNYIDYKSFGRDIRLESNGDFANGGFIEYVG